MEVLISLAIFVTLGTALFAFGAAAFAPTSAMSIRLRSLVMHGKAEKKQEVSEQLERMLEPMARALPQSTAKLKSTALLLTQAGFRESKFVTIFLGLRVLCALSLLILGILYQPFSSNLFVLFLLPVFGYLLPIFVLRHMARKRQRAIQLGLADALDLAVICVEAGLGLDQAIQRIGQEIITAHPELSEEFSLVNIEMRAGVPRVEALKNLSFRTGVDDLKALVAVLVQTDRFGTSISQALRVYSDTLRTERRQRAEEAAAKTTIKMIPALVFFVFPAMFVVTLGPVVISLVHGLLPTLTK